MTLGPLIRDLREALGYSQGRLAELLCESAGRATVCREDISRWENSKRTPGPFWLRHLAAVLEVPLTVLEDAKLHRRRFLTDMAATAIAPVVAADLISSGFSAALAADGLPLDYWQDRLNVYGRDYMSLGAAEIQRRLAHDLVVLQQHLDQPGMWEIAAKLMTLYGKTFPGSDGAKAANWYRMAAKAADRSGDDAARVWVRGRAAIALGYEGASLGMAEMFAEQAMQISDVPSLGRLNALMGKAHVAAIRGDRGTALSLLDEGRRVFDRAGSQEQTSDYAVPWWRMNVFVSLLAARLGEERLAVTAQDAAHAELPESLPRFATHLEMHKGLMLVRAGDKSGGTAYARAALDRLPPEKHSLTLRLLMQEIENGGH
ncbi:helix-turn-helix domain-containing protein [Thermomonospora cellulosilytica]|uniref:Transcriptional regulator with XRE-family HTH domain n=1 Tax=Thermomonospora cellulosilytica TaxID=1411118 RepID=A0A7W3MTQ5_9ACTN|nr:helix-turn-helix transcriptional regulator [Thermomonospora cellulosilytica]MBA9001729.1 transcriptional regulator with XRE-family HTH domain [Thermomonospora cellulosilytica]